MGYSFKRGRRTRAVLGASVLLWSALGSYGFADTLIVQGSTTFARRLMEPQKAAIEAESKHELTVIPNKSLAGRKALIEGRGHVALI